MSMVIWDLFSRNKNDSCVEMLLYLRGGRNVKNQKVEGSECPKYFLNWSERRKWRGWSERQKSERRKEGRNSKMTFDVLIFFDAKGNIRTSKVF